MASVYAGTASKENVFQYRMVILVSYLFKTDYMGSLSTKCSFYGITYI